MSFGFSGSGTRDEVVAQMAKVSASRNKAGELARDLVAAVLSDDTDAPPGAGYQTRYAVRASGHSGGGSPCSLTLTIDPLIVPAPD